MLLRGVKEGRCGPRSSADRCQRVHSICMINVRRCRRCRPEWLTVSDLAIKTICIGNGSHGTDGREVSSNPVDLHRCSPTCNLDRNVDRCAALCRSLTPLKTTLQKNCRFAIQMSSLKDATPVKNILCAVDDSEYSKAAARLAGALAAAMNANLTLLAVNELIGGTPAGMPRRACGHRGRLEHCWKKPRPRLTRSALRRSQRQASRPGMWRVRFPSSRRSMGTITSLSVRAARAPSSVLCLVPCQPMS